MNKEIDTPPKPKEEEGIFKKVGSIFSKLKEKKEEIELEKQPKPPGVKEEPKERGLTHKLKDIEEKLDVITEQDKFKKKLKKKNIKIPSRIKAQFKALAKKNKIFVILLRHNKNILPTIGEIKEGMLCVNEKFYNGSANITWLWDGKFPTAVVAEWDLEPITPELLLNKAIEGKRISHPQAIMIRALEFKETEGPKKMSGKMLIWIGVALIAVFYVLFAQG